MGTQKDFVVKKGLVVTEDIELGHATDTTIARASSGVVSIEGNNVIVASNDVSALTDSTSAAIGIGTIELGHASDTTIARASAGAITVEGTAVLLGGAQTGITTDFNTGRKVGRDAHNHIDFSTDNEIHFKTNNETPVIKMKASGEIEATSLDISGDADIDGTLEADAITLGGTAVAVSGGAFHDGFSDFVANEHIDHSGVTITAGNGLTGGGTIASTRTLTVGAGTGVTVNANDVAIGQAVGTSDDVTFSTVTLASDLIHSGDTNNKIAFGTDTQSFQTGGTARFNISDSGLQIGSGARVTEIENNDSLGTSDTKLATQGNIKAYVDANAGGASTIGALTDVLMDATNFTNGFLLQTDSDGSAPTTGTLNGALDNIGLGKDVFAALTSGDYNIGIGNDALDALTTAVENVAIGYQAGSAIQGGGYNTVLGTYALLSVTSGLENVAIGRRALGNVTSSLQYNTAVGGMSGYGATGNYSTSIGNQAGRGSIGQQGVHVGALAGYNSSGSGGINVGYRAGRYPTGNYNTFLGYEAGYGVSNNAAANNVAIGYEALHDVTTGGKNITIGYQAGDNITSGSNNLVIGGVDTGGATNDGQIRIANGDGSVTWIAGDENGIKALKIKVVAITGTTQLTDAQSGSYVYVTSSGVPELPDTAELGQQYTIINNKGSQVTVGAGASNSIVGTATVDDDKAKTFVAVAANTWFAIG